MKTSISYNPDYYKEFFTSILNSYSQVFFSGHRVFAVLLMLVSFFDLWAGLSGLFAIVVTNLIAYTLGYNRLSIKNGIYGLNSLLVGLGTGLYFQPGIELLILVLILSILTFFISIVTEGVLRKYGLPLLSISFLIGMWVVSLADSEFRAIGLSERGLFVANHLYMFGGQYLLDIFNWWNEIVIVQSFKLYLLSLGAIFFQSNVLSGLIIAIGLLINSRISFSLSIIGFYIAYYFYQLLGVDIYIMSYNYIGFNFILTSIALGGFYVIPGRYSYLWMFLLLPVVVLLTISMDKVFTQFYLAIYSLPFNVVSLVFIYALKLRVNKGTGLVEVQIQNNSPEKNLYYSRNELERFNEKMIFPVFFPFWGEWQVSQGHNGEYTHQNAWQHAWDFVIINQYGKEFSNDGLQVRDYLCYGKNVIAPADGIVQDIVDGIHDNKIGEFNTLQNWGNSIVIKHSPYLYSQISHLKSGSFRYSPGDSVKKGDVLAQVGNSGRSPVPHLHFQLQATPYVGSETIEYPISQYVKRENGQYELQSFTKPKKGDLVSNINSNKLLMNAFKFIPGQKFSFRKDLEDAVEENRWVVGVDFYSNTYLYCETTRSFAYFYNDGHIHYFKSFTGDKNSLLYHFYLAAYKIQTGYYKKMNFKDVFPLNNAFSGLILFVQDFIAPFFLFLSSEFMFKKVRVDNEISPEEIFINTEIANFVGKRKIKQITFETVVDRKGIQKISMNRKKDKSSETWIRV